jgi:hypothetical protein
MESSMLKQLIGALIILSGFCVSIIGVGFCLSIAGIIVGIPFIMFGIFMMMFGNQIAGWSDNGYRNPIEQNRLEKAYEKLQTKNR